MFNIFKKSRCAVITLASAAAISAASLAMTAAPASALGWKQHACWCKHNNSRLHGLSAALAAVGGISGATMTRSQMTRHAIRGARRYPDQAFALFARCQLHNRNGLSTLIRNRYAVTRWLQNGGQC